MSGDATEEAVHTPLGTSIGRVRGRLFQLLCAGSTVLGIAIVMLLFLYVAEDAFRPFTADPAWHLTFVLTLVLPALVLITLFLRWDRTSARVATTSVGVPVVGVLGAIGLVIVFRELLTGRDWVALVAVLLLMAGTVKAHQRFRPRAALERLGVMVIVPLLSAFGIPAIAVDSTISTPLTRTDLATISFTTPHVLPSVPDLVGAIPMFPSDAVLLLVTVTLPVAYGSGRYVEAHRDDDRGVALMMAGMAIVASAAAVVGRSVGVPSFIAVLLVTAILVPTVVYIESVVRRGDGLAGLLFPVVLVSGVIVGFLVTTALGFAAPDPWLDWGFLTTSTSWEPAEAGIYPALVGSVLIIVVIAISAFPVGVGAAIYLEEYAPTRGRIARIVDLIEINIGNLAGVPSVVYGLLGLALFIQGIGLESGIVLVGGLTVGLLILPIVIISAQESIRATPDSLRQGSYAMGATRWQTVRRVVLPEALPGILTGTILALGRAIGETAPLLMIGVASSVRATPGGFFEKTGAMPRQIFSWSHEIDEEFRYGVLAAGVVTLLVVLLLMNGTAIVLRNRHQ